MSDNTMTIIGYVAIGAVAFALGMALTMFLFRLGQLRKDREQEDDEL